MIDMISWTLSNFIFGGQRSISLQMKGGKRSFESDWKEYSGQQIIFYVRGCSSTGIYLKIVN